MARNDSKSPAKNRPASAKAAGRNKLQRPTKTQTSAKPKKRRVRHMDAVAKLLADPKANPKLKALVRKQFPVKGRAERIARAERAWKEAMEIAATFKRLDPEVLKQIAEDPDLYPRWLSLYPRLSLGPMCSWTQISLSMRFWLNRKNVVA